MKRTLFRRRRLFSLLTFALILAFAAESNLSLLAQSRRQPPTSNQKKNKRPDNTEKKEGEQQEELPPDLIGKPQEAEVVKVTTNVVYVDVVVYHK